MSAIGIIRKCIWCYAKEYNNNNNNNITNAEKKEREKNEWAPQIKCDHYGIYAWENAFSDFNRNRGEKR